jgi:hypothetical protein
VALIEDDENDVIAELERIDRFFGGEEAGDIPLEVLRTRGMDIPQAPPEDAAALHAKLMEIIEGMYAIGIVVEQTDHLSDAELYRFLVDDALLEETIISVGGGGGTWHISPHGSSSEEEDDIYLRYYADDETRERWHREFGCPLPPKEKLPYDRDRLLPGNGPIPS